MSDQIAELITELQKRDAQDAIQRDEIKKLQDAFHQLREDTARKSISSASDTKADDAEAYATFMVKGKQAAEELGYKASNYAILSGSADGGITVPTHIADGFIPKLAETSPLLGRSTVTRNPGFQKFILQSTKAQAGTRAERGAMALQESIEFAGITLGREQVFAHQAHTDEAVNGDSTLNFQQILIDTAMSSLGEKMASLLINGTKANAVENVEDMVSIPMGVLSRETEAYVNRFSGSIGKTPVLTSDTVGSFDYDDVFRLCHSLNSKFDSKAAVIINPEEYTKLAMIKDNDGHYILQRDVTASHGYRLFGKDVLMDDFMPTRATAGVKPIMVIADWSQNHINFHGAGSWVVDPYTTAGLVKYRYQEAFGAVFKDSQAIRGLVLKA